MEKFYTNTISKRIYDSLKSKGISISKTATNAELLDRLISCGFQISIAQLDGPNIVRVFVKKGSTVKTPPLAKTLSEAFDQIVSLVLEFK